MADLKPNEPTEEAKAIIQASALPRALMGGTWEMREAGEEYLPRWPMEKDESWQARLKGTFLFNGYRQAVESLVGKVFSQQIKLGEDVPTEIQKWAENINLAGDHLHVFAEHAFKESLHPGIGYILCDMPPRRRPQGRVEDDKGDGLRPYLSFIQGEDRRGWRHERVAGVKTLTMFRYQERVLVEDGKYGEREVQRVRVYELVETGTAEERKALRDSGMEPSRAAVYEVLEEKDVEQPGGGTKKEWVTIESGDLRDKDGKALPEIPIAVFDLGGRPWLGELADKNLEHWQSASDQRTVLHFARVAAFVAVGVNEENFAPQSIGSGTTFFVPVDGDFKFLEYTGDGPTMGERDLEKIEAQMAVLGLEPLMERPGSETATARAIDEARANSRLIAAVRRFNDALEQALRYMAIYAGLPTGGSINTNEDVGLSLSSVEWMRELREMRKQGDLSRETLLEEAKRRGGLSADVDVGTESRTIDLENMGSGPTGTARTYARRVMELVNGGLDLEAALDQVDEASIQ